MGITLITTRKKIQLNKTFKEGQSWCVNKKTYSVDISPSELIHNLSKICRIYIKF